MGEIADQIVEQMIWGSSFRRFRPRRKTFQSGSGDYMWRTLNGVVSMDSMSEEHLQNAIEVCKRRGNLGKRLQLEKTLEEKRNA